MCIDFYSWCLEYHKLIQLPCVTAAATDESCFRVRLTADKYQQAIAGLVMARSTDWSLDIREHEFTDTGALCRALCSSSSVISFNNLSFHGNATRNSIRSLQRDRYFLIDAISVMKKDFSSSPCCRRSGCLSCFFENKEFKVQF